MSCHVTIDFRMTNSDREVVVVLSDSEYRLVDGSRLPIWQTAVWCSQCHDFEPGEKIPSITSLRKLLLSTLVARLLSRPSLHRIKDLRRRIKWRRARRSPPRCLTCGGTDLYLLPRDSEFVHPETGERMRYRGGSLLCCEGESRKPSPVLSLDGRIVSGVTT